MKKPIIKLLRTVLEFLETSEVSDAGRTFDAVKNTSHRRLLPGVSDAFVVLEVADEEIHTDADRIRVGIGCLEVRATRVRQFFLFWKGVCVVKYAIQRMKYDNGFVCEYHVSEAWSLDTDSFPNMRTENYVESLKMCADILKHHRSFITRHQQSQRLASERYILRCTENRLGTPAVVAFRRQATTLIRQEIERFEKTRPKSEDVFESLHLAS